MALAAASGYDAAQPHFLRKGSAIAPAVMMQDPRIQLFGMEQQLADPAFVVNHSDEIAGLARASLRQGPLLPEALRDLAMVSGDRGHALVSLADRVSRRDLLTQLWLIELAVQQDNIGQALKHYDAALLVYPDISETLYDRLAVAIEDRPVRDALHAYVGRPWFVGFVSSSISRKINLAAVAQLLTEARPGMKASNYEQVSSLLLQALISQGDYDIGRKYLLTLPGAGPQLLRDIGFQVSDPRFAPVSWALSEDTESRVEVSSTGVLKLELSSGKLKQVAVRVTYLAPGSYELLQNISYDASGVPVQLRWQVDCLTAGHRASIWQQSVPVREGQVTYRSVINIPGNCFTQNWALYAQGDEAQNSSQGLLQLSRFTRVSTPS